MKIKDGYMLRELDDMAIVVAVGKRAVEFNGMITLNSLGAFIWKCLCTDTTEDKILADILNEYDVDSDSARKDLSEFLKKIRDAGLIDE